MPDRTPPRRPVPPNVGAVLVLAAVLALLLGSCSRPAPTVGADPAMTAGQRADCRRLVAALPDTLAGRPRTPVRGGYGAAWGDPPIVLRCRAGDPPGFDALATCQITDGVAWFIPRRQITGSPVEVTMGTVGRSPNVAVRIPADYFPPAEEMVALAPALKAETTEVERCG